MWLKAVRTSNNLLVSYSFGWAGWEHGMKYALISSFHIILERDGNMMKKCIGRREILEGS